MNIVPQLTTAGQSLLITALSGGSINFTKIVVGDGAAPSSQSSLTNLVNPLIEMAIEDFAKGDACVSVTGSLTNDDVSKGFYWKETGLFAEDGDGNEVLYAYCHTGDLYEYIPSNDSGKSVDIQLTVMVAVDDAENVTATISDNGTYVSRADFNSHINDTSNPHKVTLSQLGAGDAATRGVDTSVTSDSINLITSGAVYSVLQGIAISSVDFSVEDDEGYLTFTFADGSILDANIGVDTVEEGNYRIVTSNAVYKAINKLDYVTLIGYGAGSQSLNIEFKSSDTDNSTVKIGTDEVTKDSTYLITSGAVYTALSKLKNKLYVKADDTGDGYFTGDGTVYDDLIEAIDAASEGSEIIVLPGTHSVSSTSGRLFLYDLSNLTIRGLGENYRDSTIISFETTSTTAACMYVVKCTNLKIKDLSFINSYGSSYSSTGFCCGRGLDNVIFENLYMESSSVHLIYIYAFVATDDNGTSLTTTNTLSGVVIKDCYFNKLENENTDDNENSSTVYIWVNTDSYPTPSRLSKVCGNVEMYNDFSYTFTSDGYVVAYNNN